MGSHIGIDITGSCDTQYTLLPSNAIHLNFLIFVNLQWDFFSSFYGICFEKGFLSFTTHDSVENSKN